MALPIRPNSGAAPQSESKPVKRPLPKKKTVEEVSLPSFDDLIEPVPVTKKKPVKTSPPVVEKAEEPIEDESLDDDWAIDPKTGKKYKKIPKSVYDGKGKNAVPRLAIEDFDVDNMTGEAETYLSHLRVAPNKKEQAELLQLRKKLRERSDESYEANHREAIEKANNESQQDIVEITPKKKATFLQKLTGLFR